VTEETSQQSELAEATVMRWEPQIRQLILDHGLFRSEIIRLIKTGRDGCKLSPEQLSKWIDRIQNEIANELGSCYDLRSKGANLGISIFRHNALYLKAVEKEDYVEARKIQLVIDRLQGLRSLAAEQKSSERSEPPPDETAEDEGTAEELSEIGDEELRKLAEGEKLETWTDEADPYGTDEDSDSK